MCCWILIFVILKGNVGYSKKTKTKESIFIFMFIVTFSKYTFFELFP